ncbi:MAG: TadE family protein [Candidatus Promineifilaceae bacterium]|nr:TadE family protein [Candidatus Promineifilaceae bacterium]
MNIFKWLRNRSERGQSLAEVTIMLPLIIALLAGVIEVSNILIAQNRVTTAAGAATSFAVTNFREDTLPTGWDTAMAEVAVNSVRNTPQEAAEMWDFAVVRAKTAQNESDGSIYFESWEMATPNGSDGMPSAEELQNMVLEDIGSDGYDMDLIITVAHGQYDSILNLDSFFDTYPDKLTAISVGVVDKAEEPAAICLKWTETESGENGPVPAISAIDVTGNRIAVGAFEGVSYTTKRTWEGGEGTGTYAAENKPTGSPPSIKFDATGDQLGDDGVETDTFIIVLEEQATHVRVFHKAPTEQDGWMALEVGNTVETLGYVTRLVGTGTDGGDPTYTFETTSAGPEHALSHIEFRFKKTKTVTSVCEEWGTPDDTGNFSDIVNP